MQIHARINDDELVKIFRRLAVVKFGKMRGALSLAMEEAMREWVMKQIQYTHTNTEQQKLPPGATGRRLSAILTQLAKMWDGNGSVEVPVGLIRKVIKNYGHVFDARTINKYIHLMIEMYILEPLGAGSFLLDLGRVKEVIGSET